MIIKVCLGVGFLVVAAVVLAARDLIKTAEEWEKRLGL